MSTKKIKKILVIAESIDVEDSSGSKGRIALIKNLSKLGYNLKVYHYSREKIELDGIECVEIQENRKSFLFFLSRFERYLRNLFKIKLNKPIEKLFGFSFTLLNDRNSIVNALNKENRFKPDLVFTLSKGGSFRPHHALLKIPKWHSKWVAYIHDPYPMHVYPPPYPWKEPGFKKKEEFVQKVSEVAAHAIFPSLLLKNWMGNFFPDFLKKGEVIPHQLEIDVTEFFDEQNMPDFFDRTNFNMLHAGNLLQARKPFGLIEGFELFLKNNYGAEQDCRLIFIGPAQYHETYLQDKTQRVSGLIVINQNRNFQEVKMLQEIATVNIILEAKSHISPFLPGKFPHCVKANAPILHLGPENSETRRLLGPEYPYWAEVDDAIKISQLIEDLYQKWRINKNIKLDRPDLVEYLSPSHLNSVIEKILSK